MAIHTCRYLDIPRTSYDIYFFNVAARPKGFYLCMMQIDADEEAFWPRQDFLFNFIFFKRFYMDNLWSSRTSPINNLSFLLQTKIYVITSIRHYYVNTSCASRLHPLHLGYKFKVMLRCAQRHFSRIFHNAIISGITSEIIQLKRTL